MAGHFRHRALFIGPNARRPSTRAGPTTCPVFLSDVPALFTAGALPLDAALSTSRRPTRTGSARSGPRSRRARGDRRRDDGDRAAQPRDAADARRQLHPRRPDRPRRRGRRAAVHEVARPASATSSGGSASSSPTSSTTARRSSSASARSRPRRRLALRRQARPRRPHRDVHGRGRRPRRGGRRHRRAQGAQPGQDRRRFMMGTQRACTASSTTTRWSRCARSTHQRHRRDPLVPPDDGDQLGDRGRPHRPGGRGLDRPSLYCGVGGQMDFIRGAALAPRAGRSSRCRRRPAEGHASRGSADARRRAPGRHHPGPRPDGRDRVRRRRLLGRSLRERAEALIAIAHPDLRDRLAHAARRLDP